MGTNSLIYRAVDVWKRTGDNQLVRYRCFEVLPNGGFCVQSADFYNVPLDLQNVANLDHQFIELLAEEAPDIRSDVYQTVEEAIAQHDAAFEN